ncbi:guanine nucleotide-binding protein subunit beta-like protein 1 [Adelges cooleyi]|uniref:guanine nucleotide-binding protein subunit beta-like protein 1 n=1 Tax=Adelges cooleyi TaxID=133065 RepID=UPI00217F4FF9|nr:guanine nucleotide-binding protein subunit beta-like protein 1 [Adelges cooleyi]XP_050440181.1 guanine nucleotide-binding protein subunit beta-like protein 1 [Adelges cooleyi]XP_050440182.1 guanine nucleotide-binding protein subunit beta-like protein 1 [Adelges cooleyi]
MSKHNTPTPVYTFKCDKYVPNCVVFHTAKQLLYVGTQTGEIHSWNLETNRQEIKTNAGNQSIMNLEILIKKNQLVSQNKFGEIRFWTMDQFKLSIHHILHTQVLGFCKFSLYKTELILCKSLKEKSILNCYSTESYEIMKTYNPDDKNLGDLMTIKTIKDYIFCAYESCKVIIWCENSIVETSDFPDTECLMALDVDSSLAKGVCAGSSDTINTFHIADSKISCKKSVQITNPGVSVLRLRPDDKIVAAACWDSTVKLFSWKSMKLLAILDSHSSGVLDITYSKSLVTFWKTKYMLAVACKDNKITLWDIYNGQST